MEHLRTLCLVTLGVLVAATPSVAQVVAGQFQVSPRVGYYLYDEATPFKDAASVGADARYFITENLGIGLEFDFARPVVDGSYFKNAYFVYPGPINLLIEPGQQVTQVIFGAFGIAGLRTERISVLGIGGGGVYTLYYDPQVIGSVPTRSGNETFTQAMLMFGGGVEYMISEAAGVRVDVVDDVFLKFDREKFNPVELRWQNDRNREPGGSGLDFPEANGSPPEASETVHNFRISLAFQLIPGQIFR
ncbi:MAG: outer membrane beta-barrel protein [Gemmatimonadota bacterium]|nr:MAG: outer membrane beta-barrel protein [Gemmatimonadota bacterium]